MWRDIPGDEWMTAAAVAKRFGLQLHTVFALIDSGDLVGEVTVPGRPERGRGVRVRPAAVEEYIERPG